MVPAISAPMWSQRSGLTSSDDYIGGLRCSRRRRRGPGRPSTRRCVSGTAAPETTEERRWRTTSSRRVISEQEYLDGTSGDDLGLLAAHEHDGLGHGSSGGWSRQKGQSPLCKQHVSGEGGQPHRLYAIGSDPRQGSTIDRPWTSASHAEKTHVNRLPACRLPSCPAIQNR